MWSSLVRRRYQLLPAALFFRPRIDFDFGILDAEPLRVIVFHPNALPALVGDGPAVATFELRSGRRARDASGRPAAAPAGYWARLTLVGHPVARRFVLIKRGIGERSGARLPGPAASADRRPAPSSPVGGVETFIQAVLELPALGRF